MPYINPQDTPSFLKNASTPDKGHSSVPQNTPQKSPGPEKEEDKSLLGGKSQVSRYQFERSLNKDAQIRQELAKELKLRPYSPEMNAAIKDMKERVPKIFGGYIDKSEAARLKKKQYWDEKHELREMEKGGITPQESKEMARSKIKNSFLNRLFGIDK